MKKSVLILFLAILTLATTNVVSATAENYSETTILGDSTTSQHHIIKAKGEVQDYTKDQGYIQIKLEEFTAVFNFDEDVEKTLSDNNLPKKGSNVEIEYYDSMGSSMITSFKVINSGDTQTPVKVEDIIGKATKSKMIIDAKEVIFDAYLIDGNNYFKLRDMAYALKDSKKEFEVSWDNEKKAINLVANGKYKAIGGELTLTETKDEIAIPNKNSVYMDGNEIKVEAYTINGNTYFKLRDLAQLVNVGIEWDSETKTIKADTTAK